jgi:uncharacterized membrane protein YphA (DoxX/SURF4 family)
MTKGRSPFIIPPGVNPEMRHLSKVYIELRKAEKETCSERKNIHMDEFLIIARFIVGGTFIIAGASKLADISAFFHAILSFELLSPGYGRILAWFLPIFEITVGLMLFSGIAFPFPACAILLLLAGFCTALLLAARRKKLVNCGCFGAHETPTSYKYALFRNLMLIVLTGTTLGATPIHQPSLWQIITSQEVFALPLAVGLVILFRLANIAWRILQKV